MQVATSETYSNSGLVGLNTQNFQNYDAQSAADSLVLSSTFAEDSSQSVNVSFQDLYKSLTVTAQQIVDKINDILKAKLPNGVQSLSPEDVTPEASADTVVSGITGLFNSFAKQNSDLDAEELIAKFIEEAKKGVEQGYGDATETLKGLGAFDFEGVESGISKTKELILQKLDKFAEQKLEELQGKEGPAPTASTLTKSVVLQQSAGGILDLAA